LRKFMPITFWTFIIGTLALAGIFPFAGFWSKDEILVTAGKSGFTAFMIVGLVGAFLTAAYMTRCVYLTFFGEYRGHGQPHESERAITVPLIVLSVFSVLAGVLAWSAWPFHIEKFKEWVEPRVSFPVVVHPGFDYSKAVISLAVAKLVGKFTYEKLDQKGVDGAINGMAEITGESGGLLRYLQSGRVQRYALLLFGAVGLLSLFLLLANT